MAVGAVGGMKDPNPDLAKKLASCFITFLVYFYHDIVYRKCVEVKKAWSRNVFHSKGWKSLNFMNIMTRIYRTLALRSQVQKPPLSGGQCFTDGETVETGLKTRLWIPN
jgi:hypothetical protein